MKFVLLTGLGFVIASVAVFSLSNFAHPFLDDPSNHVSELRNIPEVRAFYDIYGSSVDDPVATDKGQDKYRIVFTAQTQETASQLEVYYLAWMPFSVTYKCANFESEMVFLGNEVRDTFAKCSSGI